MIIAYLTFYMLECLSTDCCTFCSQTVLGSQRALYNKRLLLCMDMIHEVVYFISSPLERGLVITFRRLYHYPEIVLKWYEPKAQIIPPTDVFGFKVLLLKSRLFSSADCLACAFVLPRLLQLT